HLSDVWAVSPNLAWAAGATERDGFVARWNGSSWKVADGPRPGWIQTVWAGSEDRAWAASHPFEHWDGSAWRVVSVNARHSDIWDLGGLSRGAVWAVGSREVAPGNGYHVVTTILRHDVSGWHLADSPSPGSVENVLYGVGAVPGGGSWAVGEKRGRRALQ